MNENPSVRIESTRSKTSNNSPLKNGSVVSNFLFGHSSTFTRALMHSKQYGGSLVCVSCNNRPHNRYLLLQELVQLLFHVQVFLINNFDFLINIPPKVMNGSS